MASTNESNLSLREELISTAVKFLSNPNIQRSPLDQKHKFLRSKGLTDNEINKAFELGASMVGLPAVASSSELFMYRHSRSSWFRELFMSIAFFGGITYGIYWVYKKWFESLLFGDKPKKKSVDEKIADLKKSLEGLMMEVKDEIVTVRSEVDRLSNLQGTNAVSRGQLEGLKSDIASVKGILLNRNQFPSLNIRTEPPSIPAWQLQSSAAAAAPELAAVGELARGRGQRSESGGSNSSEGEAVTNNSNSSLEIIS